MRHKTFRYSVFLLLAMAVPVLAGSVVYQQTRTPVLDAEIDSNNGTILGVVQDSFANWAGFKEGDVILSVNGTPYPQWPSMVGNYPAQVQRGGQVLQMEIPLVPMAKVNLSALLGGLAVALIFWGSGLLLLLRRFENPEIRLLFLLSQVLAIAILFPLSYLPDWRPPQWGMDLSVACLFFSAPLIIHHYLSFPVRFGAPRFRQWGLGTLYLLSLIATLLWLDNPILGRRVGGTYIAFVVAAALGLLGYVYLRRAAADERRRLRLTFFGSLLGSLPALLLYFLPSIFNLPALIPLWLAGLFTVMAPLSYLLAILRYNLFGIDRLLNRTLVYTALSLGILLLYLGPFLLIIRFAPGDWLAIMMVAAGLTLGVGLAFERTKNTLQRWVDRLFYGGWYDYPEVVEQVTRSLAGSTDRTQLGEVLTRQTPQIMHLQGGDLQFDSSSQTSPPSSGAFFPLFFQGQPRALWIIGPHRNGDDLSDSDRQILDTLAHQAEIALGNILLIETLRTQLDEIRASSEALAQAQRRLLHSRDEERTRLARDLHDGPLQALIGLNLQLGLQLPQAADPAALNEMRAEIHDLLHDLREVCSKLRPPMLDTLGLAAGIRSLAEEWSAKSCVAVCLDLPSNAALRSLPDEVAVNLYRVAQEALSNIARHAHAQRANIQLANEMDGLSMTIEDDGQGFTMPGEIGDLTTQGHFGLVGLLERVNLIGGSLNLHSSPGHGTRIRVDWRPSLNLE